MKKPLLILTAFCCLMACGGGPKEAPPPESLPEGYGLDNRHYGVVTLSVVNMRSSASYTSGMISQALMGMPVELLRKDGWYEIRTPDEYTGWVHPTSVTPMTKEELDAWKAADKIVVTAHYGFAYEEPDETARPVSDVVGGNRFVYESSADGFYKIRYPDGRQGYISDKIAMPEAEWRAELRQDAASILETAYSLTGIPYLWAGTSSKGVDCSGFVRTVLYMHDIIIPRDAWQQAAASERILIDDDFGNLKPADLIFFGQKAENDRPERVVHVAFYIGDKRYIHSQGYVHISSFDPEDEAFDANNLERLLYAGRILPNSNDYETK